MSKHMFERRHYKAIAELLSIELKHYESMRESVNAINAVVESFVALFNIDNSNFDETRFRKAVYGDK